MDHGCCGRIGPLTARRTSISRAPQRPGRPRPAQVVSRTSEEGRPEPQKSRRLTRVRLRPRLTSDAEGVSCAGGAGHRGVDADGRACQRAAGRGSAACVHSCGERARDRSHVAGVAAAHERPSQAAPLAPLAPLARVSCISRLARVSCLARVALLQRVVAGEFGGVA
jgi:hypothetical protein